MFNICFKTIHLCCIGGTYTHSLWATVIINFWSVYVGSFYFDSVNFLNVLIIHVNSGAENVMHQMSNKYPKYMTMKWINLIGDIAQCCQIACIMCESDSCTPIFRITFKNCPNRYASRDKTDNEQYLNITVAKNDNLQHPLTLFYTCYCPTSQQR